MSDQAFQDAVLDCVTMLAETFGRQVTKPTIMAYEVGLAGMTAEQVKSASAAALRTSRFMPTPVELRELGGTLRVSDRAERAWIAFDRALSEHSIYKTLLFDDVVINAVVRSLGGLQIAAETPADEYLNFYRARFLKAYEALARSRVGAEQCGALLGQFDQINGTGDNPPLVIPCGMPALPGMPRVHEGMLVAVPQQQVPRLELKRP